jgi:hypothetical protein
MSATVELLRRLSPLPPHERAHSSGARSGSWTGDAWHIAEFAIAVGAGVAAGSVALVGFGVDSVFEALAGGVVVWLFSGGLGASSATSSPRSAPGSPTGTTTQSPLSGTRAPTRSSTASPPTASGSTTQDTSDNRAWGRAQQPVRAGRSSGTSARSTNSRAKRAKRCTSAKLDASPSEARTAPPEGSPIAST